MPAKVLQLKSPAKPLDWTLLLSRRRAVVALVAAGVAGIGPSLDAAPAAGQERSWLEAWKVEASKQLDTIQGWIAKGTDAAKAKAKAALEAMKPMLTEAKRLADAVVLLSPMGPPLVVADVAKRAVDMGAALGGVAGVGNVVFWMLVLWAVSKAKAF